jgi:hypothetical protein
VKRLPRSTKSNQTHGPGPQRERIVSKFIEGKGIRQISREEGRSRETITKIVRSEDVQCYVADLKQQYVSLGHLALETLTRALRSSKDGKLAHQILVDIGVSTAQVAAEAVQSDNYDEEREVQIMMGRLVQAAAVRLKAYGLPMGELGKDLKAAGIDLA